MTDTSSLQTRVDHHINCADGRAGAAIVNVTTGETVMSHADQIFGTASSIKAFVLFALLRKADEEGVDLTTKKIDGETIISLATSMIEVSSNSAANTLIKYVTMDKVNEENSRDARPVSHQA